MRTLAWTAIGAQAAFTIGWVVAGTQQPGYSATRQVVSRLAAGGAAHPWIVTLALLAWAGGFAALAAALPGPLVARGLFAACALLAAALAVLPLDCPSCARSWHHVAHLYASGVLELVLLATPFALRRHIAGAAGLAICALVTLGAAGADHGLWQRVGLLSASAWVVLVAAPLTSARGATPSRRSPRPARPHPAARR